MDSQVPPPEDREGWGLAHPTSPADDLGRFSQRALAAVISEAPFVLKILSTLFSLILN